MQRSDTGEIVKRALAYPYASPQRSFVQEGEAVRELEPGEIDLPAGRVAGVELGARTPLLAYGANAAPEALARKLALAPLAPLPVLRAELEDFDVVYSAHVSPYGAVPATLRPSPGTSAPVHVVYPDAERLSLLVASEPNYGLTRLREISLRVDADVAGALATMTSIDAFLSRHGCLEIDGAPLALAAIGSRGRHLPEKSEPEMLEFVRSQLSPDLTLEQFILGCVEIGGVAPLPQPLREAASGSA